MATHSSSLTLTPKECSPPPPPEREIEEGEIVEEEDDVLPPSAAVEEGRRHAGEHWDNDKDGDCSRKEREGEALLALALLSARRRCLNGRRIGEDGGGGEDSGSSTDASEERGGMDVDSSGDGEDGVLRQAPRTPAAPNSGGKVYTCSVCFKDFDRLKAMHGHMRVHERGSRCGGPSLCRREEEEQERVGECEEYVRQREERSLVRTMQPLLLSIGRWPVTGQRGRKRRLSPAPSQDREGSDETKSPLKKTRAEAAPPAVKEITSEDKSWIADMISCAQNLVYLKTHRPHRDETVSESNSSSVDNRAIVAVATEHEKDNVAEIKPTITTIATVDAAKSKENGTGTGNGYGNGNGKAVATVNTSEEESKEGAMAIAIAPRMFSCALCDKSFTTHQGLGGHMASHKKGKEVAVAAAAAAAGENGAMVTVADTSHAPSRAAAKGSGKHICDQCGEEYPTGQALGGHKRKHYTGPLSGKERSTPVGGGGGDPALTGQKKQELSSGPPCAKESSSAAAAAAPVKPAAAAGGDEVHSICLFGVKITVTQEAQ